MSKRFQIQQRSDNTGAPAPLYANVTTVGGGGGKLGGAPPPDISTLTAAPPPPPPTGTTTTATTATTGAKEASQGYTAAEPPSLLSDLTQAPKTMMVHPQMGQVKGPQEEEEEVREEVPYPVYIRPYDDELPHVSWKKNPSDPFGTLQIVKGEDKMIVKVPMKDDRILPRVNYPVEIGTVAVFLIVGYLVWKLL